MTHNSHSPARDSAETLYSTRVGKTHRQDHPCCSVRVRPADVEHRVVSEYASLPLNQDIPLLPPAVLIAILTVLRYVVMRGC